VDPVPPDPSLADWHRLLLGKAPFAFLLELLLRATVVYLALLLIVRLLGKRMSGQLTNLELGVANRTVRSPSYALPNLVRASRSYRNGIRRSRHANLPMPSTPPASRAEPRSPVTLQRSVVRSVASRRSARQCTRDVDHRAAHTLSETTPV
jgi:hypothetical protein